ncbi:hypothetical protein UFOVP742_25 [uncultured Caudovirales phage]|uniref:Uncharacterized protein n=1 Tax=uncultured Caudovirales phage TaxID=2100421 RepID=A0A6J7X2C7_9CAUD|nr:hypothetical protein UFOVP742_25 [uncultured Caudovirales phage]
MTDEQINAAIAEACGWKEVRVNGNTGVYKGFDNGAELRPDIPDYCTDLNAMHEAEKVLTKAQWEDFIEYLSNGFFSVSDVWKDVCHATARERAEAFLRTLGKWDQSGDTTEMVKEVQK